MILARNTKKQNTRKGENGRMIFERNDFDSSYCNEMRKEVMYIW